ncbi:MAG: response regulator [Clostridia bacterium]|nr:response regulator [Clostridia bacterium]
MIAICVDDERRIMEHTVRMCLNLPRITEAKGFTRSRDALEWLETHSADLALLDIEMPEMNGIELTARIKQLRPDIAVIFLTGYAQYALDAFSVHANGYLMKPVMEEKLSQEIAYALANRPPRRDTHILIQTFSGFDVFVDGEIVAFSQAKCKELLAFLVDKQGNSVTRSEAFAALWEDRAYDRAMQKLLDNIIRSMRQTLEAYHIAEIFEMQRGTMRIRPEAFTCDAYRFFLGDSDAVSAYRGEYMSAYSWASITESYMDFKSRR